MTERKDTIYVFSNFHDVVGWGAKMRYDFQKPIIVTRFRGKFEEYERNSHFRTAGANGLWLKKKGSLIPYVCGNFIHQTHLSNLFLRSVISRRLPMR